MLVSLRALPAWVGGGLLADLHRASPSAACAPAASVSASSCPGRRGRVGARSVARAVLGVLWRDGLCVLAMPRGSHVVCASGNLSHWIQQVKEKETDTPRKTPGGARHAATLPPLGQLAAIPVGRVLSVAAWLLPCQVLSSLSRALLGGDPYPWPSCAGNFCERSRRAFAGSSASARCLARLQASLSTCACSGSWSRTARSAPASLPGSTWSGSRPACRRPRRGAARSPRP